MLRSPLRCGVQCGLTPISDSTVVKTIQMTIDERLLKLVDKLSRARKTSRSAFIRDALEAEIRRQRVRGDEIRHVEGYTRDRKSTRLNSSHLVISYAVFCLKTKIDHV